jgi:hypothetical protein
MKPTRLLLTTLLAAPLLTQCIVVGPDGTPTGSATQLPDRVPVESAGPLSASTSGDSVIIRQGGRVLSSFRAASPIIEETRWRDEQNRIVVKSRGNRGPATVQLFDPRSGREVGRVMAYDIRGGKPAWAAGMGE